MRGVSAATGPPPGFPALGMPQLMDTTLAPQSYSLLAHAGVGRGWGIQATQSTDRPQAPAAPILCRELPLAIWQQSASGRHEVTQATPYWQQVFPPQQATGVDLVLLLQPLKLVLLPALLPALRWPLEGDTGP